jgi:hypothetical protein
MEYKFGQSPGLLVTSVGAVVAVIIANVVLQGWRTRRKFIKLAKQGLVGCYLDPARISIDRL